MNLFAIAYEFPNFENLGFLIGLILTGVFLIAAGVFSFLFVKKKLGFIMYCFFATILMVSLILDLGPFSSLMIVATVGVLVIASVNNGNEVRMALSNILKSNPFKRSQRQPEALFDRDAMYSKINEAVLWFSRTKTGALITFEKRDRLDSFITTGVGINAPVSAEILETIFYEGTRLHDGAVIIRNDVIVSAACLYQPSTKPVAGKMGLRHRAAMGISQDTDSVTVVVSEETGRISIAYDGELRSVHSADFLRLFEEYMALSKIKEDDK
ncbi:MAG: DNA integrity scanning protein DisA nucleotide-binding domain protein [Bacilli bacterium]|nr:DNA integrity scanning protein DisA nucleotide-binding domain protein [Bacilli bacterium]